MEHITHSSATRGITLEESLATGKLATQYFGMEDDPDQIPATPENVQWIVDNIPECDNAIFCDAELIGFTFILPCTKDLMDAFVSKRITEHELFEQVKSKVTYENYETIYLCSAFISPTHRSKGIATDGFTLSVRRLLKKRDIKPTLFYWEYTPEGGKMCQAVARRLGLSINKRE